jgi:outer membrane lipoprotein LolB
VIPVSGRRVGVALLLLTLLAGCVTRVERLPVGTSWEARRAALQQRERFDFKGRVAVAAGQEGFNARLRWLQDGGRTRLSLDGPLGVGGAEVSLDGSSLSVTTSRGQRLDDDAARAELAARLGFEPPLRSLRYWVQGVPDPALPATEKLDAQRRLASLEQEGWSVEYATYRSAGAEWLPERMTLRREAVRVRLLVDGWSP